MDTIWSKMAVIGVMLLGVIVLAKYLSARKTKPEIKPKTFYETIAEDDRRLRSDVKADQPAKNKPQEEEISPEEIQAERLFEIALAQRKMARLPGVNYKLMVDYCREIIEKYPNSSYAPKARRMLAEVPEQYRRQHNITEQEIKGSPP